METSFLDELEKIAQRGKFLKGLSHRKGRRPMRVDKMLKKEKDGTLFKYTKQAGSVKEAVSPAWVGKSVLRAAETASPARMGQFATRMGQRAGATPAALKMEGAADTAKHLASGHTPLRMNPTQYGTEAALRPVEFHNMLTQPGGPPPGSTMAQQASTFRTGGYGAGPATPAVTVRRFGQKAASVKTSEGSVGNLVSFAAGDPTGTTGKPAEPPKSQGEVPSREDGREATSTKIPGFARFVLAPAATNYPEEHGTY